MARSAAIVDVETLGLVLREARLKRGLTQQQIADSLNVHQSYVVELEAGKAVKALDRLLEFTQLVGLTLRADSVDD